MSDLVTLKPVSETTAVITIDRPKALNAINMGVLTGLHEAIAQARENGVRQLVVTGAGEKAFVAGADIAEMQHLNKDEARQFARLGQRVFHDLTLYPGVTIAAVGGYALGGGMELAMACDLILAGPKARFGQPEVALGVIPGFGGTQRLVRLVGAHRARELILTGRHVKAPEAVTLGIALSVVDEGTVLDAAVAMAEDIGRQGPLAVRWAKRACALAEELDLEVGLQEEAELFSRCFDTADQREGMLAFLEKRSATFTGA